MVKIDHFGPSGCLTESAFVCGKVLLQVLLKSRPETIHFVFVEVVPHVVKVEVVALAIACAVPVPIELFADVIVKTIRHTFEKLGVLLMSIKIPLLSSMLLVVVVLLILFLLVVLVLILLLLLIILPALGWVHKSLVRFNDFNKFFLCVFIRAFVRVILQRKSAESTLYILC